MKKSEEISEEVGNIFSTTFICRFLDFHILNIKF